MTEQDIEREFEYKPPMAPLLWDKALELAHSIRVLCPDSEKARIAIRTLRTALRTADDAIRFGQLPR